MNINITILGQVISFVLFVWFCMKYVWNPVIFVIEQRQKEIADNLANANKTKIESEHIHSEALQYLTSARLKAQKIIEQANQCKIQIINEAKNEANREKDEILFKARTEIEFEKRRVIDELSKMIGNLVIQSTEKIIERSINEIIDKDIVNNIIVHESLWLSNKE